MKQTFILAGKLALLAEQEKAKANCFRSNIFQQISDFGRTKVESIEIGKRLGARYVRGIISSEVLNGLILKNNVLVPRNTARGREWARLFDSFGQWHPCETVLDRLGLKGKTALNEDSTELATVFNIREQHFITIPIDLITPSIEKLIDVELIEITELALKRIIDRDGPMMTNVF